MSLARDWTAGLFTFAVLVYAAWTWSRTPAPRKD